MSGLLLKTQPVPVAKRSAEIVLLKREFPVSKPFIFQLSTIFHRFAAYTSISRLCVPLK